MLEAKDLSEKNGFTILTMWIVFYLWLPSLNTTRYQKIKTFDNFFEQVFSEKWLNKYVIQYNILNNFHFLCSFCNKSPSYPTLYPFQPFQVLKEDQKTNRMHDSLELFEKIVNNAFFAEKPFIVFFNKKDLFEDKVKTKSIRVAFPRYQGAQNDIAESADFIGKD